MSRRVNRRDPEDSPANLERRGPSRSSVSQGVLLLWSLAAGVCFGLVRFGIGLILVYLIFPPHDAGKGKRALPPPEFFQPVPIIAGVSAALCGGLLWPLLVRRQTFLLGGAGTGALAALGSYLGVILYGLNQHGAEGAQLCLIGSLFLTGWLVFPALVVGGMVLSWLQSLFSIKEEPGN